MDIDIKAAEETAMQLNKMNAIARAYHVMTFLLNLSIMNLNSNIPFIQVDITSTDQIQKLKIDIETNMSPVDILVNNAAIVPLLSLREDTEDDVDRIIKVNLTAHIHVSSKLCN